MAPSNVNKEQSAAEQTATASPQGMTLTAPITSTTATATATTSSAEESQDEEQKSDSLLGPHDVLLGRGLGTYNHIGNLNFRKLVNKHKLRYVACCKVDKPKISRELVRFWRQLEPPGRFLARNEPHKKGESAKPEKGAWHEIGDKKAQEKASQCLRERTPDVMPYYKYMRACKKERKARAMAAEDSTRTFPADYITTPPTDAITNAGVHAEFIYQKQFQEQEKQRMARAAAAAMQQPVPLQAPVPVPPPMSSHVFPLTKAPGSLLQLHLLKQQQQQAAMAARQQIQTTPMVPLELLLRREQELKDRELEAQILRSSLHAAVNRPMMSPSSMTLQPLPATSMTLQPLTATSFHQPMMGAPAHASAAGGFLPGQFPLQMPPQSQQLLRAQAMLQLEGQRGYQHPQEYLNYRVLP